MDGTRTVMPTLLLRSVVLAALVAPMFAALTVDFCPAPIRLIAALLLLAMAVTDFVFVEFGSEQLARVLARRLWRRDRARGRGGGSIWYRDRHAETDAEQARFHRDTEDNPTVR